MELFEPHEKINTTFITSTSKRLIGKEAICNYPNRIHLTPVDCNRFNYGESGGGGIGFAIKSDNNVKISISSHMEYKGVIEHKPIALRAAYILKSALNCNENFSITVNLSKEVKSHVGLGSNACLMTAICAAINSLYGKPLTDKDLMKLIGANFAESYMSKCVLGLDTGIAPSTTLKGGFTFVTLDSIIVWMNKLDFIPYSFILFPNVKRASFEGAEDDNMLQRSLYEDIKSRGYKTYEIVMDLIPAIENKDIKKMGDIIWNIQFSGTHLSMIQSYEMSGSKIYDIIGNLKTIGAEIVGLSSVGPCIYIGCSNFNKIKNYIEEAEIDYLPIEIESNPIDIIVNE